MSDTSKHEMSIETVSSLNGMQAFFHRMHCSCGYRGKWHLNKEDVTPCPNAEKNSQ